MKEKMKTQILRTVSAGNAEKSDVLVSVSRNPDGGVAIELRSVVKAFYEDAILASVKAVAKALNVTDARIELDDYGALDYVIRARVETALLRAAKEDDK